MVCANVYYREEAVYNKLTYGKELYYASEGVKTVNWWCSNCCKSLVNNSSKKYFPRAVVYKRGVKDLNGEREELPS